jgi:hypothetical protein
MRFEKSETVSFLKGIVCHRGAEAQRKENDVEPDALN